MPQRNVASNFTFEQQRVEINNLAQDFWTQKGTVDTAASTYLKHDGSNDFTGQTLAVPNAFTINSNSGNGTVTISGNLDVTGTTTTVSSANLEVTDKNILIAKGSTSDAQADGAGITIDSATDITFNFVDAKDALVSSIGLEGTTFLKAPYGQFTGSGTATVGQGVEINAPDANTGQIISYDRANTAYKELRVKGSSVGIYGGTSNALVGTFNSTGLDVVGNIDSTVAGGNNELKVETTSSGDPSLSLNASGSGGHTIEYIRSTNELNFKQGGGSVRMSIAADGTVDVARNLNANLGLDVTGSLTQSGGNAIIGTTVWSYPKPLNVQGSTGAILSLSNYDTTTYAADTSTSIEFKINTGNTNNVNGACEIRAFKENGINGNSARGLSFWTAGDGGSPAERLRITSGGTLRTNQCPALETTPGALNISGDTAGGRIALHGTTTSAGAGLGEIFAFWGATKVAGMIALSGANTGPKDDAHLLFYTRPDTATGVQERLRIDSAGRVLIGESSTTAPARLAVNGCTTGAEAFFELNRTDDPNADQNIGVIEFSQGNSVSRNAARLITRRDGGVWGAASLPTRFEFHTCISGSNTAANRLTIASNGNVLPGSDDAQDLGSSTLRWANVYTGDMHLNNMNTGGNDVDGSEGHWTMQEGSDDLFLINRNTGKKYKFNLTEVS